MSSELLSVWFFFFFSQWSLQRHLHIHASVMGVFYFGIKTHILQKSSMHYDWGYKNMTAIWLCTRIALRAICSVSASLFCGYLQQQCVLLCANCVLRGAPVCGHTDRAHALQDEEGLQHSGLIFRPAICQCHEIKPETTALTANLQK